MAKHCRKWAILLTIIFALPIFILRALPYEDRASRALVQENCTAPCFMNIRPGVTTMQDAVYVLGSHAWVANGSDGFSALVRSAVFYDAGIPRTVIDLRWSAAAPEWIDAAQPGGLSVEDREVLDVMVETHLSLGEIILAFGEPDESWFVASNNSSVRRFEYRAWYASEGMLVIAPGLCPVQHYYHSPVRIHFHPDSQVPSETVPRASVCSELVGTR